MTKLDIANMALDVLRREPINSLTFSNIGRKIGRLYETAAAYVLTLHDWQEAVTWTTLEDEATDDYTAATSGNDAGLFTFIVQEAVGTHTPQAGTLTITISAVATEFEYTSWSSKTFTISTALPSNLTSSEAMTLIPNNWDDKWGYMYDLPSDCLKVLQLRDTGKYEYWVEGSYIYTNEYDSSYGIELRYIKDIRDEVSSVVVYSDLIADLIAHRIAYQMAPADEKQMFRGIFEDILQDYLEEDIDEKRNLGTIDAGTGVPKWTD